MALHGPARKERLLELSEEHPAFGPIWVALAEEHLAGRRREEALYAVRRALRVDPDSVRRCSPALAQAASHLIPRRAAEPASSDRQVVALDQRGSAARPTMELTRAKALAGSQRRERLIDLTHQFPNHGPTWLALAEENLAQRRAARAMTALDRALHLDPGLEQLMSPRLEEARRLYKKEAQYNGFRPRVASDDEVTRRAVRDNDVTRRAFKPQPWQPGAPAAAVDAPAIHEEAPAASSPRVGAMLARAVEISSPGERLAMLRELWKMAPDHPAVLFHVALESALAGHTDDARRAGRSLQTISPGRYAQFYAVAQSYWPGGQGGFQSSLPQAPYVPTHMVKQQASASARTMYLQVAPPAGFPVSAGQVSHPAAVGEPDPHKTEILSIPPPPMAGFYPVASPAMLHSREAQAPTPGRGGRSRWRTAGALVAGVAAGLLFAMLVMFVVGRASAVESSRPSADTVREPALVQKAVEPTKDMDEVGPDDPMFMLTP
jgi:tetratricopeptide (TPR) repeat protein